MHSKFNIYQSATQEERPPISHKVKDYLIDLIIKEVLEKKNIIVNARWNIFLALYFFRKGKYGPDRVFLAKGSRTVSAENIKIYEVIVPIQVLDTAGDKYLKTIELMFEAITLFLTSNYKKITADFMAEVWKKADLEYLHSLPYPAPFEDQKYPGDEVSREL